MSESQLDSRTLKKGLYRHYKGLEYEVVDTAYHSETEELLVLYRPLYGNRALWVRPFDMFVDQVEVDGKSQQRFQWIK